MCIHFLCYGGILTRYLLSGTPGFIMWWTSHLSKWYHEWYLVDKHHVNCYFNCFHFIFYLFGGCYIIQHHCFRFFLTFLPRRKTMSGPKIVWVFFLSVTLIRQFLNMLSHTMQSKSSADGPPTMLYADLDFSASVISLCVKPSLFSWTVCTNVVSTVISVGFAVMVIHTYFDSS